jgi:hypothetical protein
MVMVDGDGVYFSGLNTEALLALSSSMGISEYCSLPRGCHNARPHLGGVLFNDTRSDVLRFVSRDGGGVVIPVPTFSVESLEYRGVDDSNIARQGFGRGLCVLDDQLVAIGSSPSTISIMDINKGQRITGVNLTMDIRNAIHGLERWPAQWT